MNESLDNETRNILLIVEDFDAIRNLLGKYFQNEGYTVISVGRTQDVLLLGKTEELQIVLVDLDMSGDDPYHTISTIHEAFPSTYVILMEGNANHSITDKAIRAGAREILKRTYDLSVLKNIVDNIAQESHR